MVTRYETVRDLKSRCADPEGVSLRRAPEIERPRVAAEQRQCHRRVGNEVLVGEDIRDDAGQLEHGSAILGLGCGRSVHSRTSEGIPARRSMPFSKREPATPTARGWRLDASEDLK